MAFIVFEGLDGAGKSSLINKLIETLKNRSEEVVLTREPGGTPLAEEIRELLLKTTGETPVAKAELLLYQAARAQHVETKILPALSAKNWVICDRFTASTYAFQKGGRGIKAEEIHYLSQFATSGLRPCIQILLDLPVDVSLSRIHNRSHQTGAQIDRFEQENKSFHQNVRDAYLELAHNNPEDWIVLDATKMPDDLFEQLKDELRKRQIL